MVTHTDAMTAQVDRSLLERGLVEERRPGRHRRRFPSRTGRLHQPAEGRTRWATWPTSAATASDRGQGQARPVAGEEEEEPGLGRTSAK